MLSRTFRAVASTVLIVSFGGQAQTAEPLQWDVISVKPMSADTCARVQSAGVRYLPDGLSANCVPVVFAVEFAYRVMDKARITGLPDWANGSELYSIEARVSGDNAAAYRNLTHDDQARMLRSALTERFHLRAHMEQREMPAYDLVVAKGGPKLRQPEPNEPGASQFGTANGHVKWANAPLTNLKFALSKEVGRPIVDKTGLTGKYDFDLEFAPAGRAETDENTRPSIFTALEEQLGLKLVPSKEPVEALVVDSIERPGAN